MQRAHDTVASRPRRSRLAGLVAGLVTAGLALIATTIITITITATAAIRPAAGAAVPAARNEVFLALRIRETTNGRTPATGFRLPLPGRAHLVRAFVAPVNRYAA